MKIFGPQERRKIDPIGSQQIYCLHTLQFNLALIHFKRHVYPYNFIKIQLNYWFQYLVY